MNDHASQLKHHMMGLSVDEAASLVMRFHYSRRAPANVRHCYGVVMTGGLFGDRGEVVAAAMFSTPPTRWSEEVLELIRLVRKPDCESPMSELVSFALKALKRAGWNLVVSFADKTAGHFGGVYQACNWNYDGCRPSRMDGVVIDGVFWPGRSCNSKWGTRSVEKLRIRFPDRNIEPHYDVGKHLYWKPLHNSGLSKAKRLGLKSVPYPRSAARPKDETNPMVESVVQPHGAAPL